SEQMLDLCDEERLAFLPWAPILDIENDGAAAEIAKNHDVSPRQVVLAWLLARSPSVVPIPGTGTVSHLEQNVAAAGLHLGADEVERLSRAGRA
ncbi:MAG: aldo/keto reductase, partial [Acidimicrobiales bacterium]